MDVRCISKPILIMRLFSKLFGLGESGKQDHDHDFNYFVGLSALKIVGYSTEPGFYENTLLYQLHSTTHTIPFTALSFYDEASFYLMTLLETQERYGVIDAAIKLANREPRIRGKVNLNNVLNSLNRCCIDTSSHIVKQIQLKDTLSPSEISSFLDERFMSYKDLQIANTSCDEAIPIPSDALTLGLSKRDHPTTMYLGAVSDNISSSLGLPDEDVASRLLVEMTVMSTYTGALSSATQALSNASSYI